jgi:hypothetical protein
MYQNVRLAILSESAKDSVHLDAIAHYAELAMDHNVDVICVRVCAVDANVNVKVALIVV